MPVITLKDIEGDNPRKKLGVNNGPALISVSEFVRDPRAPVYVATVSAKLQLTTSRLNAHGVLTNS